jgi:hypothetical protein
MIGWARYGIDKKRARTRYVELVFWHLVGSMGHIVRSCASGARSIDALFFIIWWAGAVSIKSTPGHVPLNLCFRIRWDLRVT